MIALAEADASLSAAGQIALYPALLILAGALLRWVMGGIREDMKAIRGDVASMAATMGNVKEEVAVLKAHRVEDRKEIDGHRQRLHDLSNAIPHLKRSGA